MNPATLKMALNTAIAIRERVKDYREEKAREAYDLLSDAASNVDVDDLKKRSSALLDDSRKEAGNVTQAARARLEKALDEFDSRRGEVEKKTGKQLKKARRNLPAKRRKAAKRRKGLGIAGVLALLASLAAAAYYWFVQRPKQEPGTTPPRVQDFTGSPDETVEKTESTLVYSTTTPTDGAAGPLAEDPAERDEELLGNLDEQLQKHRSAALDEAGVEEDEESLSQTESVDELTDPDVTPELAEDDDKKA